GNAARARHVHRYTRPYRPQTNGKIERFWRTLDDDVIDGATFDNLDHFANELFEYMVYYNNFRPHQALGGKTPKDFAADKKTDQRISELAQLRADGEAIQKLHTRSLD
ncbi:integrase-like protein, partial [Rhodopseudomonas thermotolerans]